MLNKVIFSVSPIIALLWVACSSDNVAGGTIDPNTVAQNSSTSSEEDVVHSSSSTEVDVAQSSSSETPVVTPDNSSSSSSKDVASHSSSSNKANVLSSSSNTIVTPTRARNFSIQCIEDVIYVDLDAPQVASDVGSPVAYKRVEGDSVNVSLLGVYFDIPCAAEKQKEFMENVKNPIIGFETDTLYVNFSRSKGMVYDCSCAAKATFTLDKAYSYFNYTFFDHKQPILVQTP